MVTETALKEVLSRHSLSCAAVVANDGQVILRVGDFASYHGAGLVSGLLGPQGDPLNTFSYLESQVLPRIWSQGKALALLDKPFETEVVVLFGTDEVRGDGSTKGEAVELYRFSRLVASSLRSSLGAPGLP